MGDCVMLRGVRFFGRHGVSRSERRVGQWYSVDIDLRLDLTRAGETDDLKQTVDYAEVCKLIVKTGTRRRFRLMEALAHQIAQEVFKAHPSVENARVRVVKTPPAGLVSDLHRAGELEYAAVEIERINEPEADLPDEEK